MQKLRQKNFECLAWGIAECFYGLSLFLLKDAIIFTIANPLYFHNHGNPIVHMDLNLAIPYYF